MATCTTASKGLGKGNEIGGGDPRNIPRTQLPAKAERPVLPKPLLLSPVVFSMDSQLKPILSPRLRGLWGHNPSAHVYPQHQKWGVGVGAGQELQTWLSLLQRPTSIKWVAEKVLKRHGAGSKQPRRPEIAFKHLPSPRSCYLGGINTSAMF